MAEERYAEPWRGLVASSQSADRVRAMTSSDAFIAAVVDEPAPAFPVDTSSGDLSRITLRLSESLKEQAERAAAAEGISVNAWLVRAVAAAVGDGRPQQPAGAPRSGRRVTGFAQA